MLSRLREHLGTAGLVVAIVALVAALAGGAIAANGGSDGKATASAKGKQGPRGKTGKTGKTGPQGPAGPAGPAGPQGPAGPKGDTGAPGSNGSDGAKGVTGATGATGATGKDGKNGVDGVNGEPWTPNNTLPPEATETGVWRFISNGETEQFVPISFPIPLSKADAESITMAVVPVGNPPTANCPGTAEEPQAIPGFLCVYASGFSSNFFGTPVNVYESGAIEAEGVSTSGGLLYFESRPAIDRASGSFAVTAPEP